MDNFGFWQVAGLNPVIDEGFTEASISHDEFQINQGIRL
ncbi:hypothetical protein LJ08_4322 [Escherichia coli]|nr:hypothetical protein LJ08_4322 [Escherichia coli]